MQEGWIREKEQILSSEDHGKDLTGALRLLSQHKAFEDEMSGRAAHLQQTIKQGDELVADNHFGSEKIKERIQDIQVGGAGPVLRILFLNELSTSFTIQNVWDFGKQPTWMLLTHVADFYSEICFLFSNILF